MTVDIPLQRGMASADDGLRQTCFLRVRPGFFAALDQLPPSRGAFHGLPSGEKAQYPSDPMANSPTR